MFRWSCRLLHTVYFSCFQCFHHGFLPTLFLIIRIKPQQLKSKIVINHVLPCTPCFTGFHSLSLRLWSKFVLILNKSCKAMYDSSCCMLTYSSMLPFYPYLGSNRQGLQGGLPLRLFNVPTYTLMFFGKFFSVKLTLRWEFVFDYNVHSLGIASHHPLHILKHISPIISNIH